MCATCGFSVLAAAAAVAAVEVTTERTVMRDRKAMNEKRKDRFGC